MKKTKLVNSIALAVGASVVAGPAQAQIEEIVVTATKRAKSSQDIPVAIQACRHVQRRPLRGKRHAANRLLFLSVDKVMKQDVDRM